MGLTSKIQSTPLNELYLLEYLGHSGHLNEIALFITRLNYDIYITPKIVVVACKTLTVH